LFGQTITVSPVNDEVTIFGPPTVDMSYISDTPVVAYFFTDVDGGNDDIYHVRLTAEVLMLVDQNNQGSVKAISGFGYETENIFWVVSVFYWDLYLCVCVFVWVKLDFCVFG
jgi:hypothetical protein